MPLGALAAWRHVDVAADSRRDRKTRRPRPAYRLGRWPHERLPQRRAALRVQLRELCRRVDGGAAPAARRGRDRGRAGGSAARRQLRAAHHLERRARDRDLHVGRAAPFVRVRNLRGATPPGRRDMSDRVVSEKRVAAGLSSPEDTVGLTGLVPFEVIRVPEVKLAPKPGVLRCMVDLPAGRHLQPGRALTYRVHGGEAGVEFDRNGQIVNVQDTILPLVLAYSPREYPAPPARGELSFDFSFWHSDGTAMRGQDVQWRLPVRWDAAGGTLIDLRFTLRD